MIWLRVVGGLLIVAALFGAVRWVANTLDKAERTEKAEARVVAVEREKADLARTFADAQAGDNRVADDLRAFRAEEADRAEELRKKIGAQPVSREVQHVDPKTGITSTCRERDPARYRGLFNEAVGPAYP